MYLLVLSVHGRRAVAVTAASMELI